MKKKNMLSMMLAGCLALSLTACGGSSESGAASDNSGASGDSGTITLGMIGPLTGSVAVYGTHIENGVKLAIEEINAAGGVTLSDGAHQLAVEVKDDQGDSTECVNAMNALISDGIQLVVGSATSGCTSAITSIANSEGVVMITPSGTADSLTTTMDYVFRTCFLDNTQAVAMAEYAADTLKAQKVAVLYDITDDYSLGLAEAFQAEAEAKGMEVVAYESFQSTDTDFKSQLSKIRRIRAELPQVEHIIVIGHIPLEAGETALGTLRRMGRDYLAANREEFLAIGRSIRNDDYATITYTSGTTADPKGVVLTHRNYTANVEQPLSRIDIP
ncbi:MAG: hypothetical protein EGQ09_02615, partial [Clostridiales bacterium]|nr:hypothetical protein [Clostridiales bacterium]